ncbi:hypothetical protein BLOT_014844 [Blomia tropicalis]|nr:hypothetical protein BLOT_014844 [Blomia tropicalis]
MEKNRNGCSSKVIQAILNEQTRVQMSKCEFYANWFEQKLKKGQTAMFKITNLRIDKLTNR